MHGVQLYVDLDQVLADFDEGYNRTFGSRPTEPGAVDWARVAGVPNFYQTLPPMLDWRELWAHVRHRNPIILTGKPVSVPSAEADKKAWVARPCRRGCALRGDPLSLRVALCSAGRHPDRRLAEVPAALGAGRRHLDHPYRALQTPSSS